jgi:hypothetical protein
MTPDTLHLQLDPARAPDATRQAILEKIAFNANIPAPEVREAILQVIEKEPVKWIRQVAVRILKKYPPDGVGTILPLLDSHWGDVRLGIASLLQNAMMVLNTGKKQDTRKSFEEALLPDLLNRLKSETTDAEVRIELYKTLARFTSGEAMNRALIEAMPDGDEEALYVYAQYVQGTYPPEGLPVLLSGYQTAKRDETTIHLLRALGMTLPKEGDPTGYPHSEPVLRTLLAGLGSGSEPIRKEAAMALASRARAARKTKTVLPIETEIWEALYALYARRLTATTAPDRDHAKEALRALPAPGERLAKIFELMHRVQDELQKQNVVDLIGSFKTEETRLELIKMLKVNFAGLRLEAQKTTIDAASGFVPNQEVEAELEKLLEGKGLHADIQAKLADRLFSGIPSLKARLQRWLRVDAKSQRPVLERFELPMMHIKIIESSKKVAPDPDIRALLLGLAPLLMMNDAKVKLHESLREFPAPESTVLAMDQVAETLLSLLAAREAGRIVFEGFTLPAEFGGSRELEYGNVQKDQAKGLSAGASQMAKDFVKKIVTDLFSGEIGPFVPAGTRFRIQQQDGLLTISAITAQAT